MNKLVFDFCGMCTCFKCKAEKQRLLAYVFGDD